MAIHNLLLTCALLSTQDAAPKLGKPILLTTQGMPEERGFESVGHTSVTLVDVDRDGAAELVMPMRWNELARFERAPEGPDTRWTLPGTLLMAGSERLAIPSWNAAGALLTFTDFDQDGWLDLLAIAKSGEAHIAPGNEEGFGEARVLLDSADQAIALPGYEQGGAPCVSVMALDWEGDGDQDLLLASESGLLYLRRNEGTRDSIRIGTTIEPVRLAMGTRFIVHGGLVCARCVDWDQDGAVDLVCVSQTGNVSWCRGSGWGDEPHFQPPVPLIAPPEPPATPGDHGYIWHSNALPIDYDGDGDMDLLVGGSMSPPAPELTAQQHEEREALRARISMLEDRAKALVDEPESDANTDAQVSLWLEVESLEIRLEELNPNPRSIPGLWLYRRE